MHGHLLPVSFAGFTEFEKAKEDIDPQNPQNLISILILAVVLNLSLLDWSPPARFRSSFQIKICSVFKLYTLYNNYIGNNLTTNTARISTSMG